MHPQAGPGPWWAALTVWGVVNVVNVLQVVGFLSRIRSGTMVFNHRLGYVMIRLAGPALVALVAFVKSRAGFLIYLILFFGAILLMGLPMSKLARSYQLVTVVTSALLLASMVAAIRKGVG